MSTVFISERIWPELTKAVRGCRLTCQAAVAYFGQGAAKLLPRHKGSRLVALLVAKKRRAHSRGFEMDSFRLLGKCGYQRGDVVAEVTDEGGGRVLVAPPGNVLHVRTRRDRNRQVSFVYLERPARRRWAVKSLARILGRGALKRLRRDGI